MFRKPDMFLSSGGGGGGKTPTLLGPLERARLNRWGLRMETDPVSETLCFLLFRIPDAGISPEAQ
jgi:hypothetical protein